MSSTLTQAFTWPRKCTHVGCERRPRQAIVQVLIDEDGRPRVLLRGLCNHHRDIFLAVFERDASREEPN